MARGASLRTDLSRARYAATPMRAPPLLFAVFALVLPLACGPEEALDSGPAPDAGPSDAGAPDAGPPCPTADRPGLEVTVADEETGARLCAADVSATEGSYAAVLALEGSGESCEYVGLRGRAGSYVVTAAAGGYAPASGEVTVPSDGCGVAQTQSLSFSLVRRSRPDAGGALEEDGGGAAAGDGGPDGGADNGGAADGGPDDGGPDDGGPVDASG